MEVNELQEYLSTHQRDLVREILGGKYVPDAIRGVEIPKSNEERKFPEGRCLGDIWWREPRSGWAVENRVLKFIHYADDFSIYTRSKSEARSIGNEVYVFIRYKLALQINRE